MFTFLMPCSNGQADNADNAVVEQLRQFAMDEVEKRLVGRIARICKEFNGIKSPGRRKSSVGLPSSPPNEGIRIALQD